MNSARPIQFATDGCAASVEYTCVAFSANRIPELRIQASNIFVRSASLPLAMQQAIMTSDICLTLM